MTDELKKRVFVILNITLSTFPARDSWYAYELIEQAKMILNGSRLDPFVKKADLPEFLRQVQTMMYLSDISVEDMSQVLADLRKHWEAK